MRFFLLAAQLLWTLLLTRADDVEVSVVASPPPASILTTVTSRDGTKINVEAVGNKNGPHVIFAHGLACTLSAFDPLFTDKAMLSKLYMVRFDTRGHGLTGKPTTADGYSSDRYADDIKAIIARFGLVRPFFVGWSLGGAIAADIAANFPHPLPFSGLIWIAGLPYFGDILPKIATPLVLSIIPGMQQTNNGTLSLQSRIDFVETLSAHTDSVPLAVKTSWVGSSVYLPPYAANFVISRTQNSSRLLQEGAAGWPCLIVHGSEDLQINGTTVINTMTPLFKNVESHLLKGIGHIPFYDDEPAVSSYILNFITRVTRTKPYP